VVASLKIEIFEFFLKDATKDLENENKKEGPIESPPKKLSEVYMSYLEVLEENERDIVDCGWSDYRISEKKLIKLLENRVRGEKIELPEG
jgi:hypothetical protein